MPSIDDLQPTTHPQFLKDRDVNASLIKPNKPKFKPVKILGFIACSSLAISIITMIELANVKNQIAQAPGVNFDAVMMEVRKQLVENPPAIVMSPQVIEQPPSNLSLNIIDDKNLSRQVRVIASGVYEHYWKNASKQTEALPPWKVINY